MALVEAPKIEQHQTGFLEGLVCQLRKTWRQIYQNPDSLAFLEQPSDISTEIRRILDLSNSSSNRVKNPEVLQIHTISNLDEIQLQTPSSTNSETLLSS